MKSQNALILAHLLSGNSITSLEAFKKFQSLALHSRCHNIRQLIAPYVLQSTPEKANGKHFNRYFLNLKDIPKIKKLDSVKQLLTTKKAA